MFIPSGKCSLMTLFLVIFFPSPPQSHIKSIDCSVPNVPGSVTKGNLQRGYLTWSAFASWSNKIGKSGHLKAENSACLDTCPRSSTPLAIPQLTGYRCSNPHGIIADCHYLKFYHARHESRLVICLCGLLKSSEQRDASTNNDYNWIHTYDPSTNK